MVTRISAAAATGRLKAGADHVVDRVDAGAGPGYVEIREGAQPASVGAAATGTLLATLPLSDPAFGPASDAAPSVASLNAVTDDTADATGTAGWCRFYDSNDNAVIDGAAGGTGSGAELELDDVNIVAGGTISVSSGSYTQPDA